MPTTPAARTVEEGFDEAAGTYDVLVGLNPGYRRHLRAAADAVVAPLREPAPVLLDLGCGSGLSTRALLDAARARGLRPRIVGVDASGGMLAQARRRDWPAGVEFRQGTAEALGELDLPRADGALACYLLRNVGDLPATLAGVHEALRPGARFVAEDYSVRGSRAAARRWALVNRAVILPLARVVNGDVDLYRYLHDSVDGFATMPELADALYRAGFRDVASRTVGGWQRDILHLIRATA